MFLLLLLTLSWIPGEVKEILRFSALFWGEPREVFYPTTVTIQKMPLSSNKQGWKGSTWLWIFTKWLKRWVICMRLIGISCTAKIETFKWLQRWKQCDWREWTFKRKRRKPQAIPKCRRSWTSAAAERRWQSGSNYSRNCLIEPSLICCVVAVAVSVGSLTCCSGRTYFFHISSTLTQKSSVVVSSFAESTNHRISIPTILNFTSRWSDETSNLWMK